jgi:hypothetical protein
MRSLTGTRVIALLLGRLKVTVLKCILACRQLSLVLRDEGYSPLLVLDKLLPVVERIVSYYGPKTEQTETAETYISSCYPSML